MPQKGQANPAYVATTTSRRGASKSPFTRKVVIAASHGILAGLTDPGWPIALERWISNFEFQNNDDEDPRFDLRVLSSNYHAGIFPAFNYFFRNPLEARWLANALEGFSQDGF